MVLSVLAYIFRVLNIGGAPVKKLVDYICITQILCYTDHSIIINHGHYLLREPEYEKRESL